MIEASDKCTIISRWKESGQRMRRYARVQLTCAMANNRTRNTTQPHMYVKEIYMKELTLPWVIKQKNVVLPAPCFSRVTKAPAPETSKDWIFKTLTHNTTRTTSVLEQKENFTFNIGEHNYLVPPSQKVKRKSLVQGKHVTVPRDVRRHETRREMGLIGYGGWAELTERLRTNPDNGGWSMVRPLSTLAVSSSILKKTAVKKI